MPVIAVDLDPPLTGVLSQLHYIFDGVYYYVIDMPLSIDGTISASVGVTSPGLVYVLVFPQQTIEGVIYRKTESITFNLFNDVSLYVVLESIPAPPTVPVLSGIIAVASPLVVGLVLTLYGKP